MFTSASPALIIIDMQQAIDHFGHAAAGTRSQANAEANTAKLLQAWRQSRWPVVHIRHSSKSASSPYHRGSPHFEFKPEVKPQAAEVVIIKQENCAFIGTDLEAQLRQQGVSELVVCGVLINHSVDATVRIAAALGFKVLLPADATAAMGLKTQAGDYVSAERMQDICLSNLSGEYAQITEVESVLAGMPGWPS